MTKNKEANRLEIQMVPVEEIRLETGAPWRDDEEENELVKQLVASTEVAGEAYPVLLARLAEHERDSGSPKRYQCLDGAKRVRAKGLEGASQIAAIIVEADEAQAKLLAIDANLVRQHHKLLKRALIVSSHAVSRSTGGGFPD